MRLGVSVSDLSSTYYIQVFDIFEDPTRGQYSLEIE